MTEEIPQTPYGQPCDRCGETFSAAYRFCPYCGEASDDAVRYMNEYRGLRELTTNLRENALRADGIVDTLQWIAAGGRGVGSVEDLKELAAAMRRSAEVLEERADEVPDPRYRRGGGR